MTKLIYRLYLFITFCLLSLSAHCGVQVYGCSGAVLSDYCAPTPAGEKHVPGFDVTQDDQIARVPATTDPEKQPEVETPPPIEPTGGYFPADPNQVTACRFDGTYPMGVCETLSQCLTNYQPLTGGRACVIPSWSPEAPNTAFRDDDYPLPPELTDAAPSCPSGYSESDGQCYASDPRQTEDDDTIDLQAKPDYTYEAFEDFDASQTDSIQIHIPTPSKIVIGSKTADGRPLQVSGTIGPNGSQITVQEQGVDGNGNSVIKTTNHNFDADGNQTGTSVSTKPGNLEGGGDSGTYTPTDGDGTNFPNDYSRQGEAQRAADSINHKLEAIKQTLDQEGDSSALPSEMPDSTPLAAVFGPLSSMVIVAHSGLCPAGSFEWQGHTYSFDTVCTLFDQYASLIQSAMLVVYTLAALFIVLGA